MEQYTFEIWESSRRFTKTISAENRDLAWERITMMYPNASYIDEF